MSKLVVQDVANVVGVAFSSAASIAAGKGVLVGTLFGVAETDIAGPTAEYQLRVRGVVQIAKAGTLAVAIGDTLYWDDSGKVVNKTNTTKEVGQAVSSTGAGAGEVTVNMLIVPTLRNATAS
jgi:predicted RecA/RadA family phage recombinase